MAFDGPQHLPTLNPRYKYKIKENWQIGHFQQMDPSSGCRRSSLEPPMPIPSTSFPVNDHHQKHARRLVVPSLLIGQLKPTIDAHAQFATNCSIEFKPFLNY
jgi:hypothetical protein